MEILTCLLIVTLVGCGTTKMQTATEQLVLSDAVDRSIEKIDFRPLSGQKVYLDSTYIRTVRGIGFVNADYVISGLRQQVLAAGCLLQEKQTDAEIIIEPRMGALGADDHQVTYGLPESNLLASASQLIPAAPALPAIPELSLARRESREGAAKIAVFAYDRESKMPIWQSGVNQSVSTARSTWVLGVGPIQTGSIRRNGPSLAGSSIRIGRSEEGASPQDKYDRPSVNYMAEVRFDEGKPVMQSTLPSRVIDTPSPAFDSQQPVEMIAEKPKEPKATQEDAAKPDTSKESIQR